MKGLYILPTISKAAKASNQVTVAHNMSLPHEHMTHVRVNGIRFMIRKEVMDGIKANISQDTKTCTECIAGKAARDKISKSRVPLSPNVLHVVHIDVCGKLLVPTLGEPLYFVSFIEDHLKYCWI